MSFFSALTVPGLQQHLSFSREDSAILKGYGNSLHDLFIMSSAYTLCPQVWIRYGLLPSLPKPLPSLKLRTHFIFITGYAMGWKTNSSPTFGSLIKTGFSHYFKFWKIYFLCLLLAILVSWAFPLPILPSVADMDWKNGLLVVTGLRPCYPDWWYMALFAAATMALYPICARITHHIAPVPSMAALLGVSLYFKVRSTFPACRESPHPSLLSCPASFSATCTPFWLHASLLFQFPTAWEQSCCWLLKYYPSISSVFQSQNPDGYLSLHPLVSALDNPETPPHTALDAAGNLFRTYVAESQIHFRLPLQLGPLWNPKHQRSIHRDAGLLPSAGHGHAKTFNRMIPSNPQTQSKTL